MTDEDKRELADLQRAHSKIGLMRKDLVGWRSDYHRLMTAVNAMQGMLGKRINDLKSEPHEIITDHAILRYMERFTDIDTEEIKQAIRDLPEANKIIEHGNVLTVHPDMRPRREKT